MKISPKVIKSGIDSVQQQTSAASSETLKATKEAIQDPKATQTSKSMATVAKAEQSLHAGVRESDLRNTSFTKIADQHAVESSRLHPVNTKLQELKEQLIALTTQKKGLIAQIVNCENEIKAAEYNNDPAKVVALSRQLQDLKSQLASVESEIKSVLNQIEDLQEKEKQTSAADRSVRAAEVEKSGFLEHASKNFSTDIKAAQSQFDKVVTSEMHNASFTKVAAELAVESSRLHPVNTKLQELKEQLIALTTQKKALIAQIVSCENAIHGAEFNNDQADMIALSRQLQDLKSQLAAVELEVKSVLNQIDKLQQKEDEEAERARQAENSPILDRNLKIEDFIRTSTWKKDDDDK